MPKIEFPCTKCGVQFEVERPPHEIINGERVSMVVLTHDALYSCTNCGQQYVFMITGLKGAEYGWQALQKKEEEDSGIILPPRLQ